MKTENNPQFSLKIVILIVLHDKAGRTASSISNKFTNNSLIAIARELTAQSWVKL